MTHIPDVLRQACSGTKSGDSVYFAVDEFHLERKLIGYSCDALSEDLIVYVLFS
jgi:hypothetical protein